jgi:plastocyanin
LKEVIMVEHAITEHKVNISIKEKKFKYNKECLCVERGDTITWKLNPKFPYGIVIKALVSPLDWSYKMTGKGEVITAKVSKHAAPGLYPYGVGAFDGEELLFDDPEIIVRRPG